MNVKIMYLLLRITRIHIVWIGFNRYYENSDGRTCRKIASWNFICYTRSTSIIFLFWRSIYVLGTIQGNFSITIIMTIFLIKLNAENPQWLYYMVVPGIMLISLFFLTLSHYIHSEKIRPLLQSSTSPPEDEEDQELIDSDENSESFR